MAIYFFIFSNFLKTLYNTLLPFFSYLAYFYKYFDRKELNVHHFVDMHVTTGVTQYLYLDSFYFKSLCICDVNSGYLHTKQTEISQKQSE